MAVGRSLKKHHIGIICVTPENMFAPWVMFEAGALSRSGESGRVIPLLLSMTVPELTGPLSQFLSAEVTKDDMLGILRSLNNEGNPRQPDDAVSDILDHFWPELRDAMASVANMSIPGDSTSVRNIVNAFASRGLGKPAIGDQAFFESGFESHALYGTLNEVMTRRLYVCGRKNRKLFDKEHGEFFASLPGRIASGFDLRILFLNPESPPDVLIAAHKDDDLGDQLKECIDRARRALRAVGLDPARYCRLYGVHRTLSFTVVDDAVLYAPIALDSLGAREGDSTKAPFVVINVASSLGTEILERLRSAFGTVRCLSPDYRRSTRRSRKGPTDERSLGQALRGEWIRTHRSFGKRPKSASEEQSSASASIAIAARCASVVRLPAAPVSPSNALTRRQWSSPGAIVATESRASHPSTAVAMASSAVRGRVKTRALVAIRTKPSRTAHGSPTGSSAVRVRSSQAFASTCRGLSRFTA